MRRSCVHAAVRALKERDGSLPPRIRHSPRCAAGGPARRCPVNAMGLASRPAASRGSTGRSLVALLGQRRPGPRPRLHARRRRSRMPTGSSLFEHTLPDGDSTYPDLSIVFPAANRMQRATFDLRRDRIGRRKISGRGCGRRAGRSTAIRSAAISRRCRSGSRARRTTRSSASKATASTRSRSGPSTRHHRARSLPVPDRRRKGAAPEERLGFVHKGIEKRFEAMAAATGHRLAGRVAGDSTVAYAWAYSQALEGDHRDAPLPPARSGCARWRSSANASPITWAISAISATTAASPSASRSSRGSRSRCCARTARSSAIGSRWTMSLPGGVARDVPPESATTLALDECDLLEREDPGAAGHLRRA